MAELTAYQYRAFISYSHADTSWAKWLHRALESFRIGKDLAGRETPTGTIPNTLRPVFRDRDDFTAGHSLTDQTLAALDASAALIVLCSPAAAQSKYVTEEVRLFKARHPDRPVIPLIVDGRPGDPDAECFPRSLAFKLDEDGQITEEPIEMLAADAREQGDGKTLALAKVVAGLLGVSSDDIFRRAERDRRRKSRVRNGIVAVLAFLAVAATGSAVYAWQQLKTNEAFLTATLDRATGIVNTAVAQAETYGVPRRATLALLQQAEGLFDNMARLSRPTPELRLQRARMLIEFARNYQILGDTEKQRARTEEAHQIVAALSSDEPKDISKLSTLAAVFLEKGEVLEAQGSLTEALEAYESAIDICKRQAEANPNIAGWQRNLSLSYGHAATVLDAQGDLNGALDGFRKALDIQLRLAETDTDNTTWQRDLSVLHQRIGNVLLSKGSLAEALAAYQDSLAITEHQAKAEPSNAVWQRDLSVDHIKLGNVFKAQGNFAEALAAYEDSLAITERLAKTDPSNAVWQRDLSVAYNKVGRMLKVQGNFDEALTAYQDSLTITERQAKVDPSNAIWQHDLSVDHENIGGVLQAQGDLAGALQSYRRSLGIRGRLAESDPSNAGWQQDLAIIYTKIGDVQRAQDKPEEALSVFQKALKIRARLVERDPGNNVWRRDLAGTYESVGDVLKAQGRLDDALEAYQAVVAMAQDLLKGQNGLAIAHDKVAAVLEQQGDLAGALKAAQASLDIRNDLAAAIPNDEARQRSLAWAYGEVARLLRTQGDLADALENYRSGLTIIQPLAEATPDDPWCLRALSVTHEAMGHILSKQGELDEALAAFARAVASARKLTAEDATNERWKKDLDDSINGFGGMAYDYVLARDFEKALKIANEAIALDPDKVWLSTNRAHALMMIGREDEARAQYLEFRGAENVLHARSWNEVIRADFTEMREAGIDHPLMHEIESALLQFEAIAPEAAQSGP